MKNIHEEFMREAISESNKSILEGNGPTGCVIVKDGTIIARGHNEEYSNCDPTAHAEIITIRRLCADIKSKDLSGYTLIQYITTLWHVQCCLSVGKYFNGCIRRFAQSCPRLALYWRTFKYYRFCR